MSAIVSSRTPEGWPILCPTCGLVSRLEPSDPGGDAPCPGCGQLLWFDRPTDHQPTGAPAAIEHSRRAVVEKRRPWRIRANPAWRSSLRAGRNHLAGMLGEAGAWLMAQLRSTAALWVAIEPLTLNPPYPPPRRPMYGDLHPIGMPGRVERQERASLPWLFLVSLRSRRSRRAQASTNRPTPEPFASLYDAWLDGCP
jgi:hypothetical protein